jgi:ABC-type nitrate/sulfonate/bicarbonate transport system permease component
MSEVARRRFDIRGLLIPAALVIAAEVAAGSSGLRSDSIAPPSRIVVAGWSALIDGSLLRRTAETLVCIVVGGAIGSLAGAFIGLLLGLNRWLDRLMQVTIETVRPVPAVALFPLALLIFGFGYRMEFAAIAFAALWPALILSRAAIAGVEPRLMEVASILQLGFVQRLFKIILPAALPRLLVALRLTIGLALIMAITVEISSNTIGLGHEMMQAGSSLDPARMLAFLFWVGCLGWGLNALLLAVERRWSRYYPKQAGT